MRALLVRYPVAAFFALTLAISWGGLLVVAVPGGIPGVATEVERRLPFALILLLAGPPVASLVMTGVLGGKAVLRARLRRMQVQRGGVAWPWVAVLATPLAIAATQATLALVSPAYLPAIITVEDGWALLATGIAIGLAGGLLEELGWTGFAVPRLRRRHGMLVTGLMVGIVWAVWHVPVTVWASGDPTGALSWQLLAPPLLFYLAVLPPYRVLMVWADDRSSSLRVAVLMHASLTASTLFVLPPQGEVLVPTYLLWAVIAWVAVLGVVAVGRTQARDGDVARAPVGAPPPPSA